MTIGIAASGQHAGAAVQAALLGVELLGRGSIKGFAVFVILGSDGRPQWRCTQDGGLATLGLPENWAEAERAAVISSGPNRPEPLELLLPAAAGRGMITGHRLPNSQTAEGLPLNEAALAQMAAGGLSQEWLDATLASLPELDAGLIALGADGSISIGNTARVLRRNDHGMFLDAGAGRGVGVLLNTIYSADGDAERLAALVGGIALNRLDGGFDGIVRLEGSVPIRAAERDFARVDASGVIQEIGSSNGLQLRDTGRVTVLYSGAEILGPDGLLGFAETEIFAAVEGGLVRPYAPISSRAAVVRHPEAKE